MTTIRERNHPVVENILKVMEAKGISIDELSRRSGIHTEDLYRLLKNKKIIRPYEIAVLSMALKTDVDALFEQTDE